MKTDITLILDRSGSMTTIASDTIGGINRFVADQKKAPGKAVYTLVQFDNAYEIVYDAVPIAEVANLTTETFVPRGSTALLDAVGRSIDVTGARLCKLDASKRPDKVICVIVTDGQENASHKFTREQVFDKISHQKDKYNWEFVFLGANQDAITEAAKIGIDPSFALSYNASAGSTKAMYNTLSANVMRSRSSSTASSAFSNEDRNTVLEK